MSIKHAILALLEERPMYGYELKKQFESQIGTHWSLNFGQIYLTLESLEKKGLVEHEIVEQYAAPDRKVIRLTKAGTVELKEWFTSPMEQMKGLKDQFYLKLILSLTSSLVATKDVILDQKRFTLQKLHEYTTRKRKANQAQELEMLLLLDLAIFRAEADIRWLETCEARLLKLKPNKKALRQVVANKSIKLKDKTRSENVSN